MIFLCGPLRISALSALKRLFQRRDRRDTQRTAEKDSKLARRLQLFVQSRVDYESASRNLLFRFRDARILADTPSLSLMSGEAPCLTNHVSRDGSNSFSTP